MPTISHTRGSTQPDPLDPRSCLVHGARQQMFDKDNQYYGNAREQMVGFVPKDARRLLDVGCASGGYIGQLEAHVNEGAEFWGIEPVEEAAERARINDRNIIHGLYPDDLDVPEHHFDCITFNDVLEHMYDPWEALRKTKTLLKPSGKVVASIPNIRNYETLSDVLLDGDWKYVASGVLDVTHLRFFTLKSIKRMFEETGYQVEQVSGLSDTTVMKWWFPTTMKMRFFYALMKDRMKEAAEEMRYRQWAVVASPV